MEEKIIVARFGKTKFARTETQWRYNVGQKLKFEGVVLPSVYEVHFSNSLDGTAMTQIGDETGVPIPQEYFIPGSEIYAWIYIADENTGVTIRQVTIPIHPKARPIDQQPTPDEQTVVDQLVALLNRTIDGIPTDINTALAAAKASGEFDGSDIWWTDKVITPPPLSVIAASNLFGGTNDPKVGDYVIGPIADGHSTTPTYLYYIDYIPSGGGIVSLATISSLKGDQGFSPYVDVEPIHDGHRVTITDENGPQSFDVMNGHVGDMEADLQMNGYRIKNLNDAVDDTDAVNKAQVAKMVSDGSGLFRGSFATKASLNMAHWQSTDPTQPYYVDNNDFCVVQNDESQNHECWRYAYARGAGWLAQYRINEAPMTTGQINALNSGITSSKLLDLEQFKQNAGIKLNTIEQGAQVNDIEKIRAWDDSTGSYKELPITNKTVDIPQQSGGGSGLPPYEGISTDNLFLKANYPNGDLSWENVRDICWIDATLTNNVISFGEIQGSNIVSYIQNQVDVCKRLPVINLLTSNNPNGIVKLPLAYYKVGNIGQNSSIVFTGIYDDYAHTIKFIRRSNQSEYIWSYNSYAITPLGIGAVPAPSNPSTNDVIYYNGSTWDSKGLSVSDVDGAYELPEGGIPEEDLSDDVSIVPLGGGIYQVLRKLSDDDQDYDWTPEVFKVTVTYANDTYSINTTYSDISDVISADGIIEVIYNDYTFQYIGTFLTVVNNAFLSEHVFICQSEGLTQKISIISNDTITYSQSTCGTYSKPQNGIPKTDLESAVQASLGKADTALQSFTETDPTVPSWAKASSKPSYMASEVGAAPEVTEVTVSTAGSVTQALDAGKLYHFTGALTALTITLNAAASGQIAQYHFDFDCGSTAPTVTIPNTVAMPSGNSFDANKHYEVDILNNYGAVSEW